MAPPMPLRITVITGCSGARSSTSAFCAGTRLYWLLIRSSLGSRCFRRQAVLPTARAFDHVEDVLASQQRDAPRNVRTHPRRLEQEIPGEALRGAQEDVREPAGLGRPVQRDEPPRR